MKGLLLMLLGALVAGCATDQAVQRCEPVQLKVPYEVKVPTLVTRTPPAELARGYTPLDLPDFIQPGDQRSVVGLDKVGLDRLKILIRTLKTRDDAWRAWATSKTENQK